MQTLSFRFSFFTAKPRSKSLEMRPSNFEQRKIFKIIASELASPCLLMSFSASFQLGVWLRWILFSSRKPRVFKPSADSASSQISVNLLPTWFSQSSVQRSLFCRVDLYHFHFELFNLCLAESGRRFAWYFPQPSFIFVAKFCKFACE